MGLGVDELRGKPPAIARGPVTGRVTRVDGQGVWVVPVGGDLRTPIGPCRGPSAIPVGPVVMVIYTQARPWVFGAELLAPATTNLLVLSKRGRGPAPSISVGQQDDEVLLAVMADR